MQYGYVKSWDHVKHFGFITSDDDDDLFVHVNDLDITIKNKKLVQGQRVSFDIRSDYRGDRAIHVKVLG